MSKSSEDEGTSNLGYVVENKDLHAGSHQITSEIHDTQLSLQDENVIPAESKFNQNSNTSFVHDGMKPISSMVLTEIKAEKRRIWKNLTVISLSFMCLFTAFNSVSNLQSSIHPVQGLGTASQATTYIALILSCMFVPTWLIKTLTCKWTLVVCQLCYTLYIIAQFWPSFGTLIPTAAIVGIGAAPMWSAKCTYLTQVGNRYGALIHDISPEPSITRFFGFFFMFFQTSQIWGNLISSLVFSAGSNNTVNEGANCGAKFCQSSGNSSLIPPEDSQVDLLCGILLGFALLATILMVFFVDPLTRFGEAQRQGSHSGKTGVKLLLATFQHMKNPYQIFIIPLTLWSGFEQAFLAAEFTSAYISCAWGVEHIGYVLICYGLADAIGSITSGAVIKITGRVPLFVFGACLNLSLIITLFTWTPSGSQPAPFYIIAALWGIGDAIWQTQINAFYGVIFPGQEEAAFSNYRLWESLGFAIAFAYSSSVCVNAKLWVLIGVLITGMTGYLLIEFKEAKKSKVVKQ